MCVPNSAVLQHGAARTDGVSESRKNFFKKVHRYFQAFSLSELGAARKRVAYLLFSFLLKKILFSLVLTRAPMEKVPPSGYLLQKQNNPEQRNSKCIFMICILMINLKYLIHI